MNRNYESLNYSQETRKDKENAAIRYENGVTVEEAAATDKRASIRFTIPRVPVKTMTAPCRQMQVHEIAT